MPTLSQDAIGDELEGGEQPAGSPKLHPLTDGSREPSVTSLPSGNLLSSGLEDDKEPAGDPPQAKEAEGSKQPEAEEEAEAEDEEEAEGDQDPSDNESADQKKETQKKKDEAVPVESDSEESVSCPLSTHGSCCVFFLPSVAHSFSFSCLSFRQRTRLHLPTAASLRLHLPMAASLPLHLPIPTSSLLPTANRPKVCPSRLLQPAIRLLVQRRLTRLRPAFASHLLRRRPLPASWLLPSSRSLLRLHPFRLKLLSTSRCPMCHPHKLQRPLLPPRCSSSWSPRRSWSHLLNPPKVLAI